MRVHVCGQMPAFYILYYRFLNRFTTVFLTIREMQSCNKNHLFNFRWIFTFIVHCSLFTENRLFLLDNRCYLTIGKVCVQLLRVYKIAHVIIWKLTFWLVWLQCSFSKSTVVKTKIFQRSTESNIFILFVCVIMIRQISVCELMNIGEIENHRSYNTR